MGAKRQEKRQRMNFILHAISVSQFSRTVSREKFILEIKFMFLELPQNSSSSLSPPTIEIARLPAPARRSHCDECELTPIPLKMSSL